MVPVQPQRWFFEKQTLEITNLVIGVPCFAGLSIGGFMFVHRLIAAYHSGKRW